ncbi:MAG: stalk domain-containing protein [Candidatus Wallbacteria bacterium]|nr:stalk domain-containing protein [Candidatus Wallbacteria bacterium]
MKTIALLLIFASSATYAFTDEVSQFSDLSTVEASLPEVFPQQPAPHTSIPDDPGEIPSPALIRDGMHFISAIVVSQRLKIDVFYSPVSKVVVLKNTSASSKLIINQKEAIINGELTIVDTPVVLFQNEVFVPVDFLRSFFRVSNEVLEQYTVKAGPMEAPDPAPLVVWSADEKFTTSSVLAVPAPESVESETTEIVMKTLLSMKSTAETSSPRQSLPIMVWIDEEPLKSLPVSFKDDFRALVSEFLAVDSLQSSVELIKKCNPTDINRSSAAAFVVLTTSFLQDENFQGISAFISGLSYKSDPAAGIETGKQIQAAFSTLDNYNGLFTVIPAQLSYFSFINKPSICIEILNLSNQNDRDWISDTEKRRKLAEMLRNAAEGAF